MRVLATGLAVAGFLLASGAGMAAGESGTAEEARAMLERAVAAIASDEAEALAAFTAGSDGFRDRDLYVACSSAADGTVTAHGADPTMVGRSIYELTDAAGVRFGEQIHAVAAEGELNVVAYLWPRPGETEAVQKQSYVTKAGSQICIVGYYP